MQQKENGGFSLVELIIVIAIMGIIVGALTPVMIKYIEKANVTSDIQMLDAVYQATIYAMADPDVYQGGIKNPLVMWITTTDKTGKKDTTNTAANPANINNCISIQ